MSTDIEKYDPIFNISEADKAVAKYLTPWTPSGPYYNLFIILLHSVHTHTALAGQGTGSVVARIRAC